MSQATPVMQSTRATPAIELAAQDLNAQGGMFCPSKKAGMQLWNSHPRVFLDVAKTGQAQCPYCGTQYQIKAGEHLPAH